MNKEVYAPWEKSHGFANENFLRNEKSRFGEFFIKPRPASASAAPRDPLLFSHTQWKARNRRVCVPDSQAKNVIVTHTGHRLHLFSFAQTTEKI